MYNTEFLVKYNDIEQELLLRVQAQEHEYSREDVLDICNKLYRDELSAVFYAEDILDDKIDLGITYVFEKMMSNPEFNSFIVELTNHISDLDSEVSKEEYRRMLMLSLFIQPVFYVTHQCICQQLTTNTIDKSLLDNLKTITIANLQ